MIDEQQGVVLGPLAVRDEPRADGRQFVANLKAMGVRSVTLTGDSRRTAEAIAAGPGVECESELLAQHKLRLVNRSYRPVLQWWKRDQRYADAGGG